MTGGLRVYGKEPIKGRDSSYANIQDENLPGACFVGILVEGVIKLK